MILIYISTCYRNRISFLRSLLKALGGFLKDPLGSLAIAIKLLEVVLANKELLKATPRFLLIVVLRDIVEPLLPSSTSRDIGLSLYAFRVLLVILYVPILARSGSQSVRGTP